MNHAYRLVWTIESQRYVPAPETARARGKGKREGVRQTRRQSWALILGTLLAQAAPAQPPAPNALPNGGQVVAGQAGITQRGNRMTVTQGSDKAIIDWQRFDIGRQAGVTFAQPSAGAVALNRVVAGDASQIHGQLTANGQIWLINPNRVIFGAGSRVDVGWLVASTLGSTNENLLAGQAVFARLGRSDRVVNHGEITAVGSGLIGLLSPSCATKAFCAPKSATSPWPAAPSPTPAPAAQTLTEKEGRLLLLADMEHIEVRVGRTARATSTSTARSPNRSTP